MKYVSAAFVSGLVFGLGLILSGMTDPAKVIGFLDLAGNFNPALAFVMAGAIPVAAIAFRIAARRSTALLGGTVHLPGARKIDRRLLIGALTFGAGWGVAGYCPGPALASLATGGSDALLFVAAMLGGMLLFELIESVRKARRVR
ncbi:YeeE/YedE family protein [Massilia sp. CCM 9210]|uniref:DUF6691 family protein n=1 Tax=Massilia scottii TaxID=3057166 RepID=UPI002796C203|nr:DUF6691 family protein [Massilia sp. CCM 9210]MDQ1818093.1 YeeE/YedE family protein [Massilia sp. CCM 9210]